MIKDSFDVFSFCVFFYTLVDLRGRPTNGLNSGHLCSELRVNKGGFSLSFLFTRIFSSFTYVFLVIRRFVLPRLPLVYVSTLLQVPTGDISVRSVVEGIPTFVGPLPPPDWF